ncbi:chaplin [Streptomyces sp. KLOTTS4A1]|uniref:chaplin n=1 Tax=Streptomyces sp. KLOTTS4A1 TaxID=3390996 RepID=UPI0039F4752A
MRNTLTRGAITLAAAASSIVFTGMQAQAEPVEHLASQPDEASAAQQEDASAAEPAPAPAPAPEAADTTSDRSRTERTSAEQGSSAQSGAEQSSAQQSGAEQSGAQQTTTDRTTTTTTEQTSSGSGSGGAYAESDAYGSPGILSGNSVQAPVDAPVNVCGNSADVVGVGNPAFGNECANGSTTPAEPTPTPGVTPPETTPAPPEPQTHHEELAVTGSEAPAGALAAAGAGLLAGGALLYRRGRRTPGQHHSA